MKKVWEKGKWVFLVLINAVPFALDVCFYSYGAMVDLYLFLPVFSGLTYLNYRNSDKLIPYVILQAFMLVCIIAAGWASTWLYFHNVSNDPMTPAVGGCMTFIEAAINMGTTLLTALEKRRLCTKK